MQIFCRRIGLRENAFRQTCLLRSKAGQQNVFDIGERISGLRGIVKLQNTLNFLCNLYVKTVGNLRLVVGRLVLRSHHLRGFFFRYLISTLNQLIELLCTDRRFLFVEDAAVLQDQGIHLRCMNAEHGNFFICHLGGMRIHPIDEGIALRQQVQIQSRQRQARILEHFNARLDIVFFGGNR